VPPAVPPPYFEKDTERFAIARDAAVTERLVAAGVAVHPSAGHTLYDMDALLARCDGRRGALRETAGMVP